MWQLENASGMPSMSSATKVGARRKSLGELIISHRKVWEYLGNVGLALYGLIFLFIMLADFGTRHRPSSLLLAIFEAAIVWFSLFRPMPRSSNISLYDWVIALLGSYAILFTRPAPVVHDHVLLLAAQLFGIGVSLAGLFSLNKSFGIVAVNRGVKTGGMYALVRHPIYAGYFISYGAYLAQNTTLRNAVLYVAFVTLELLRVVAEERVLSQDPDYAAYARRTRWRVLPLVY
jgi:protein-S-isoprenylcysteine O-methyltransferase Ste14